MKYKIPITILTPVDPLVNEWLHTIPEQFRENPNLMDFLVRLAPRIYHNGDISQGLNPFYKIIEILNAAKLTYVNLQKIKEYYDIDIIRYLTQDNIAEMYVGFPCHCAADLKSALCPRKNKTNEYTLPAILSNLV